ncbi:MAG: hypothetical protein ABIQ30_06595 [Devosia sp.]
MPIMDLPKVRGTSHPPLAIFHVGDVLHVTASYLDGRKAGVCKVISIVPREWRDAVRYKIQTEVEACQRVVTEADLAWPSH